MGSLDFRGSLFVQLIMWVDSDGEIIGPIHRTTMSRVGAISFVILSTSSAWRQH